jgi:hypothetical protein
VGRCILPAKNSCRNALSDLCRLDCCRLNLVSLRKTRNIEAHVLFTGIYLLKRLFVGFWASCRAAPFGIAPVFSFFASSALPPWRCAFSWFAPVVNLGLPVLASGSNRAVKPTCLRQAAYFRSLEIKELVWRELKLRGEISFWSIFREQ